MLGRHLWGQRFSKCLEIKKTFTKLDTNLKKIEIQISILHFIKQVEQYNRFNGVCLHAGHHSLLKAFAIFKIHPSLDVARFSPVH